jgi:hypothetical protein
MFELDSAKRFGSKTATNFASTRWRNRLRANLLCSDTSAFGSEGYKSNQNHQSSVREFGLTLFRMPLDPPGTMILHYGGSPGSNLLMRTDLIRLLVITGLAFVGFGQRAVAALGPFAVTLDGGLVHIASGFSFPGKIGKFQRVMTRQYDTSGQGISVGYEIDQPRIAATIYVYPSSGRLLDTEFVVRENGIVAQHQDTKLVDRGSGFVGPKKTAALVANYEYTDTFAGKVQPLRSRLIVARRGDWNIEYRFTYAASEGANGAALVDFLQNSFVWPNEISPSQSDGATGKKGQR